MSRRPARSPSESILNENQRRHFEVFLEKLQVAIDQLEVVARHTPARPDALVSYDDDLPTEYGAQITPLLASLREEIQTLVKLLEVPTRHRSRARLVRTLLTAELVRADDSYARKLRGYGAVDPRAGDLIDPVIDALRRDLVQLLSLTDVRGTDSAVPPASDHR